MDTALTLDAQRDAFARRRFLAMPLAGLLAWLVVGVIGCFGSQRSALLALFFATGCIAYLGMGLSRLTGENFLDRSRPRNAFDGLFLLTVAMSLLVYAIAIPFFLIEPSSLPLSVGILTGLMWLPISWLTRHWIGLAHGITRTLTIVAAWYLWPEQRVVVIPAVIVALYLVTIIVLERRWRRLSAA